MGHSIIPVEIGGETFWWILDTGAANTVIYAERFPVARYVHRVKGSSNIHYPLMGFRIQGYVGIIERLQVGGMLLPRHRVVISASLIILPPIVLASAFRAFSVRTSSGIIAVC